MGFGLNFRKIASLLECRDESLLFDQRGHGKSWQPSSGYAPSDYAEDLHAIVSELGWKHFVLVGHSMGGRNAMYYAWRYPERLVGLVIEDIGPDSKPEAVAYYLDMLELIPTPFSSKIAAKEYLTGDFLLTPYGRRGGATLGLYLYSNLTEKAPGVIDWRFSKEAIKQSIELGRGQDHWDIWREIKVPILVIRGVHSTDLSQTVFEEMLRTQARARGVVIPASGHWVHFDQAELFTRELLSWAQSLEGAWIL
jgi:pimeloyl-ACP methyl ester carboxylesterase